MYIKSKNSLLLNKKQTLLCIYIALQITMSSYCAQVQIYPTPITHQAPNKTTFEQLRTTVKENHIFERTFKTLGAGHSIHQYYVQLQKYPLQQIRIPLFQQGNLIHYHTISTRNANIAYYATTAFCKYVLGKYIGKEIDNF